MADSADLLGWQNTRWGMTETEIIASVGAERLRHIERIVFGVDAYTDLIIPSVNIDRYPFEVRFQMKGNTNRLIQVLLNHESDELSSEPIQQVNAARKLLSEKFGAATRDGTSNTWYWEFPSTTIMIHTYFIEDITSSAFIRFFAPGEMPGPEKVSAF